MAYDDDKEPEVQDIDMDVLLSEQNIAEFLDNEELDKIGSDAVDEWEIDEQSRGEWMERNEEYLLLAMQVEESKSYPWPDAANTKYPLLTTSAVQFSARAYPALINGQKVVKARVIGKDPEGLKRAAATRIEEHMSYQILEEMPNWEEDMDKLTIVIPIVGCAFKKTYRNSLDKLNVSELVFPQDLCVNYFAKSLEEAERVTHILELTENDIYERIAAGLYLDEDTGSNDENLIPDRRLNLDKMQGTQPPAMDSNSGPRLTIEQHKYLDLDGDGYKEPYIVTVDVPSKKVRRIVARFDEEGVEFTKKGKVARIKPIHYFTKFGFIPNPEGGFYDIGFGVLLGSLNKTLNTLINQLLDAGTLSNLQSGFISKGLRIKRGDKSFAPGEWKTVNATFDDLAKGIYPLPVREPSQVLYLLLGTLLESGEKLASVVDILMGQNPGQNQPATTTLAVIEQGLTVFTAIYKRLHRSLKSEFNKLYRLNRLFMEDEEYYLVLDDEDAEAQAVFKEDYSHDKTNIRPFSDPNISSESIRLAKAQALVELIPLGLNPDEVKRRLLEAQNQPNIEALLNVPEQGPSIEELQHELEVEKHNHQVAKDEEELNIRRLEVESNNMAKEAKALFDTVRAVTEQMTTMREDVVTALNMIKESATTVEETDERDNEGNPET